MLVTTVYEHLVNFHNYHIVFFRYFYGLLITNNHTVFFMITMDVFTTENFLPN